MGWMIVAFDLPVMSKDQRKAATDFRNYLLNDGFLMLQWSVYARSMVSHARMQTHFRRLEQQIPAEGSIRAFYVTQAQWSRSIVISGKPAKKCKAEGQPDQMQFW